MKLREINGAIARPRRFESESTMQHSPPVHPSPNPEIAEHRTLSAQEVEAVVNAAAAEFLMPDPERGDVDTSRLAQVVSSSFEEIRQDGPADIRAKFFTIARAVTRLDEVLAGLSAVDYRLLQKHFAPGTVRILHIRDDLPPLAAAAKAVAQAQSADPNKGRRPDAFLHELADRIAVFFAAFTGDMPPKGDSRQSAYFRFSDHIFRRLSYGSRPRILRAASKRFVPKPLPDGRLLRTARRPSVR